MIASIEQLSPMTTATVTAQIGNPNWKKGISSPNPYGKPKGTLNKYQKFQVAMRSSDLSPVEFLLAVMRKDPDALASIDVSIEEVTLDVRRACAIDLLPYTHQKMPQLIANPGAAEEEEAIRAGMAMMSDEELVAVKRTLRLASHLGKSRGETFENSEGEDK